jgi:hypothetical protein
MAFYSPARHFSWRTAWCRCPAVRRRCSRPRRAVSGPVAIVVFAFLLARYGLPRSIEQQQWESGVQVASWEWRWGGISSRGAGNGSEARSCAWPAWRSASSRRWRLSPTGHCLGR